MTEVNLLFLAPHWRVSLVRAFQESWKRHRRGGRLVGADCDPYSAALQIMDPAHVIPRFPDADCLPKVIDLCRRESIHAILPCTNKAIEFLDQHREVVAELGVEPLIPKPQTIATCHDKYKLAEYLNALEIPAPPTFTADTPPRSAEFPLIAKTRRGEGSRTCFRIETRRELDFYRERYPDHVYQPWIEGREYSIDWFATRDATPLVVVPRERLAVRGGEVTLSRIDLRPDLVDAATLAGQYLALRGSATLQGILDAKGKFWFTDFNLRFGSGYVHTLHAGADVPLMIHKELSGEDARSVPTEVRNGSIMTRYTEALFLP